MAIQGKMKKIEDFIVEQIDRDFFLIQIYCIDEGVGEVLPGVIEKDFSFKGTWPEVRKELQSRLKENNEAKKEIRDKKELLKVK